MAIQKSKTLASGATGNYWKVTSVTVNKQTMTLSAMMSLFMDSTHSTSASLGLTKSFSFPVTKTDLSGDLIALAYKKINAQANTMKTTKAIPGKPAVPAKPAAGGKPATPAIPAVAAVAATSVATDPDLAGGTSV